jgi:transposase
MGTKKKRRHFTPEYKAEVVRLVRTGGKTAGQAARDLDLTETSVRAWVRQAEIDERKGGAGALTTSEREELAALKREVKTLRMERDILKMRRPSSRRRAREVYVHRRGEGLRPDSCTLQGSRSLAQRLLRLGGARTVDALGRPA